MEGVEMMKALTLVIMIIAVTVPVAIGFLNADDIVSRMKSDNKRVSVVVDHDSDVAFSGDFKNGYGKAVSDVKKALDSFLKEMESARPVKPEVLGEMPEVFEDVNESMINVENVSENVSVSIPEVPEINVSVPEENVTIVEENVTETIPEENITTIPEENVTIAPEENVTVVNVTAVSCADIATALGGVAIPAGDVCDVVVVRQSPQVTGTGGRVMNKFLLTNSVLEFDLSGSEMYAAGDFALLETEVNGVLDVVKKNGWTVSGIHNHMIGESPKMTFMHWEVSGDLGSIVDQANEAFDQTSIKG